MPNRSYGNFTRKEWKNRQGSQTQPATQTETPAPAPTPQQPTSREMPLSPWYESQRRLLVDQYQQNLAQLAAARGQIQPQLNLTLARLATNQGIDWRALQASLADRGVYNSGLTNTSRGQLYTQYDRQRQDYAQQAQEQFGNIANQEAQTKLAFNQGLQELLLAAAQQAAANPSIAMPYGSNSSTAGLVDYTQFFNKYR